jgi:serine/threonine-protein kinase
MPSLAKQTISSSSAMYTSSGVVPAPRGRLTRPCLSTMQGCVVARRYRITDTIGAGGMGSVYEAVDEQTGCEVALKALQPGAYDPIRLKRLRREARTMTAVRSEHVCKVHYLGVERGTPFIVMERLHGDTLRSRLREFGPLSLGEAVAVTCQLLDALTATHEAGVIHRDVKPSNVFLAHVGETTTVKLIDFGLAKVMRTAEDGEKHADDDLTSHEMISGTLHFLAPEQLLAIGDLDERVDIYAAGVTLFEMLTGHRAFRGTYSEIIHEIVLGTIPSVRDSRPELPEMLDEVIRTAMAKSREQRYQSAEAFKTALLEAWNACDQDYAPESSINEMAESGVFAVTQTEHESHEHTFVDHDLPTLRPPPGAGDECWDLGSGQFSNDMGSDDDGRPTLRPLAPSRIPSGL